MRPSFIYFAIVTAGVGACQHSPTPTVIVNDWTIPSKTTIPTEYLAATKALLGNGLADPRGGEFHKVTVLLGNATGWTRDQGLGEKQSYGWILPDKQVVLIDGLRYPMKTDLGVAKLNDLVEDKQNDRRFTSNDGIEVDQSSIATPALLLVCGETTLAEQSWKKVGASQVDATLKFYAHLTYRYYMQVAQCLINHKDAEAQVWATKLALVSSLREQAGLNYGKDTVGWRFDAEEPKRILRDVTRRAEHPKRKFDLVANSKLGPKERIAGLVEALDEVAARQWGQPGGISWMNDPITSAIAKEGKAVVPTLLDVIENDDRMTRSVSFGRDFFPMRTIHTVRTAAYACLRTIWPSSSTVRNDDPKERITKLRELWKSSEKLTEEERWLIVLRDDAGSGKTWLPAAQHLTDPLNIVRGGGGGMTISPNKTKVMHGEPLRAKYDSEIVALLNKRIDSLAKIEEFSHYFEFTDGLSLAHCLALWSGKSAIPSLQRATKNTLTMVPLWTKSGGEIYSNLIRPFSMVIADRSNLGDKTAAQDFATLLPYASTKGFDTPNILLPLWKCPQDKEMQKAGAQLLAKILVDTSKPSRTVGVNPIESLLNAPMLLSPAFRAFLVDAIALPKEIGTATVVVDPTQGSIRYRFGNNGGGSMQAPKGMDVAPYTAKDISLNAGDFIAQRVAGAKDAPQFLLSWPEGKKAAAKKEIAKWLSNPSIDWLSVVKANPFAQMDYD